MPIGKVQQRQGFEFYCVRWWEQVTWYLRPVGAELWVRFINEEFGGRTRRTELLKLLAEPDKANAYYARQVTRLADVEAAEKELAHAERMHVHYQSDNFDPGGGRRSNPGAVTRDLRSAADSANVVERAKEAVDAAKKAREILRTGNRRRS